jgi:hypothetical protein
VCLFILSHWGPLVGFGELLTNKKAVRLPLHSENAFSEITESRQPDADELLISMNDELLAVLSARGEWFFGVAPCTGEVILCDSFRPDKRRGLLSRRWRGDRTVPSGLTRPPRR